MQTILQRRKAENKSRCTLKSRRGAGALFGLALGHMRHPYQSFEVSRTITPTDGFQGSSLESKTEAAVTPQRLADMQPTERRRAFLRVAGRILVTWAVVLGAYFLVPVGNDTTSGTAVKLVIVLFLVVGVIAWQLRRILRAKYPELRAIEALGVILVAFLALFSALYLSMSHNSASNFTQPLNHMGALYFTVTLFSTVGFGDITAKTEAARAVVTLQMVLDLVLLGALVRLLTTAARTGLGQQDG